MELNMLTITKQDSILIAVTLGIVLSVPVYIPALYGSSTVTLSAGDRPEHLSEWKDISGRSWRRRVARPSRNCRLPPGSPFDSRALRMVAHPDRV
jgi:hypothetical protein